MNLFSKFGEKAAPVVSRTDRLFVVSERERDVVLSPRYLFEALSTSSSTLTLAER